MQSQEALYRDNKDLLDGHSLLKIETSVDACPSLPIFAVMLASPRPPWVKYHNILGENPHRTMLGKLTTNSDGVIAYDSSHVDDTVSELIVPSDHSTVHCHPLAILEVRRILLEHLAGLRSDPRPDRPFAQTAMPGRTRTSNADGLLFIGAAFVFIPPAKIQLHLAGVGRPEVANFQVDRHESSQRAVVEKEVEVVIPRRSRVSADRRAG